MKRAALLIASVALVSLGLAAPVLAAAPGNDTYATRASIGSLPFSASVDTTEGTTDADDVEANANCYSPATDASVWYELAPAADTQIAVSAYASDYAAGVIVVSGSPGSFVLEGCGVAVNLPLTGGVTYAILVFDYDGVGNGGNLELSVSVAPAPPVLHVTIDPTGSFNSRSGTATVRGTITCTGGTLNGKNGIDVQMTQTVGRSHFNGYGFATFACDGTVEAWSAEIFSDAGKFAGGKATVSAYANACGDFDCGFDEAHQVVTLRK
jgi:hypothetical protein